MTVLFLFSLRRFLVFLFRGVSTPNRLLIALFSAQNEIPGMFSRGPPLGEVRSQACSERSKRGGGNDGIIPPLPYLTVVAAGGDLD